METILSQAQAPAIATSMMASIFGAVRTWDQDITLTDLFGYSGHAFILNIERTLCPSGPTAWDWGAILFPLRQVISLRRVCASCDMRGTDEAREIIWQRTIESIDAGYPAVLWDAVYPEFYLANGYDADTEEYLVQGPGAEYVDGRVPLANLGHNIGHIWAIFPSQNTARDLVSARDLALRGAVNWHKWPEEHDSQWVFGGNAWNVWINAFIEDELAQDARHIAYNHLVYAECRTHAAAFLNAQGEAFAAAADAYARVATALNALCQAWNEDTPMPSQEERKQLAEHLVTARDAEAEGIAAIEATLDQAKLSRV